MILHIIGMEFASIPYQSEIKLRLSKFVYDRRKKYVNVLMRHEMNQLTNLSLRSTATNTMISLASKK